MKPIRMFAATGMLGYGYAEESIQCALEMDLDPEFAYIPWGAEGPLWELVSTEPAHLLHPKHESWAAWQLAVIDQRLAALTEGAADPVAALDARTWGEANVPAIKHPTLTILSL